MEFVSREFIPVLLGGDINTYSVARAFYEQYRSGHISSGNIRPDRSYQSRMIEYHANPKIDTDDYFLKTIHSFRKEA